jgi:hypothetical protein
MRPTTQRLDSGLRTLVEARPRFVEDDVRLGQPLRAPGTQQQLGGDRLRLLVDDRRAHDGQGVGRTVSRRRDGRHAVSLGQAEFLAEPRVFQAQTSTELLEGGDPRLGLGRIRQCTGSRDGRRPRKSSQDQLAPRFIMGEHPSLSGRNSVEHRSSHGLLGAGRRQKQGRGRGERRECGEQR